MITLTQVTKNYDTPVGEYPALCGVDLQIAAGEFVAIVGKSGSGKSTLLNLVAGIDRPSTGEIVVNGANIRKFSENRLALWRGKNIGLVFQFFQLMPTLTAAENVMLPMDFARTISPRQRRTRALELLERVGCRRYADKLPSALSGGEQQRVAIARALANDPPLVLADEPTGNLDSSTGKAIFELFGSLVHSGKTLVVVTHERDVAEKFTRVVELSDGAMVAAGASDRQGATQ
ncbi:MAG: ABC transporter ATP-binding protein [Acidobacteriaceae bacterium]|nr:ABC transporter ATP-binding protein [Acidobacteriaceae bacterium]